jgi:hypothetical protein
MYNIRTMPPREKQQGAEDEVELTGASSMFAAGGSSRSRLAASSRLDSGQLTKALGGDYTPTDAWQDLGGSRESEQFNMRIIALSDPEHYAALRTDAMNEVRDATEKAFMTAYKQFLEAGFSREEAKQMAIRAAGVTKSVQEQAMSKKFGSNDDLFTGAVQRKFAPTHIHKTASKGKGKRRKRKN